MIFARNLLITVLVLYCCYMVFKISSKAGFFFLPLLFVLPPLIFKGKKVSGDSASQFSMWVRRLVSASVKGE